MSVINKMLRDLDRRQSAEQPTSAEAAARSGFTRDTRVVSRPLPGARRASGSKVRLAALLLLVLLGGATLWRYQTQRVPPLIAKVTSSVTAVPEAARMAAASEAAALAAAAVAVPLSPLANRLPTPATASAAAAAAAPAPAPIPAPANQPLKSSPDFSLKMANSLPAPAASASRFKPVTTLAAPASRASSEQAVVALPPAAPAVLQEPTLRRAGADEVLAQAQSLWQRGSHEVAIDLLAEALLLAERAHAAGAPSGSASVLLALARELARMELAQGRVNQALTRLTRLEPILADAPEIWALRGNAAQRLGRHAESAAAYLTALKLKPNESRWMLGAAVSLAAQGQIAAATELAEKARAAGVLSPELTTYLRQLGVKLPER